MSHDDLAPLLAAAQRGAPGAMEQLVTLLYSELRRLAHHELRRAGAGSATLHTTALAHEAYVKLAAGRDLPLGSRGQFFAVAARAMRQVIVDHARAAHAAKRGGGVHPLPLDETRIAVEAQAEELLALDRALDRLSELDERLVRVVECRFFVGLTEEQTAEALALSRRTVQRAWLKARAWLKVELSASGV